MDKIELCYDINMLYWNCCGLGEDWDGSTSRKFEQLRASGDFDLICLVETHLGSTVATLPGDEWCFSAPTGTDTHSGAAIWIGPRLRVAAREFGREGSRVAWVRFATNRGNLIVVAHYIAHMFRSLPSREDCFRVMELLLRDKVRSADRLIYAMDANSRFARNTNPITGKYCLHERSDEGGKRLESICRTFGLCASNTFFKPPQGGTGNITFIPRDKTKTGAQIDYVLVKQRFKSDITQCRVVWEHSIRHGDKYDHGAIALQVSLTVKRARPAKASLDTRPLRDEPSVAAAFNTLLAQKMKESGIDLDVLVPGQHRPILKQGKTTYEDQDREPDVALVKKCTHEYNGLTAFSWLRIAARWYQSACRMVKRGGRMEAGASCAAAAPVLSRFDERMTVREYRDVSARLLALLATAPKKNKKGPGMIAKLKRVQNALWEAIQRPVADELTRIATDGSHTLGSSDPAGWGAVVWFGESEEEFDSLFGPVISDFKVLDPNLTNKFYLGALQHSNNTGEVSAACEALLHILIKGEP